MTPLITPTLVHGFLIVPFALLCIGLISSSRRKGRNILVTEEIHATHSNRKKFPNIRHFLGRKRLEEFFNSFFPLEEKPATEAYRKLKDTGLSVLVHRIPIRPSIVTVVASSLGNWVMVGFLVWNNSLSVTTAGFLWFAVISILVALVVTLVHHAFFSEVGVSVVGRYSYNTSTRDTSLFVLNALLHMERRPRSLFGFRVIDSQNEPTFSAGSVYPRIRDTLGRLLLNYMFFVDESSGHSEFLHLNRGDRIMLGVLMPIVIPPMLISTVLLMLKWLTMIDFVHVTDAQFVSHSFVMLLIGSALWALVHTSFILESRFHSYFSHKSMDETFLLSHMEVWFPEELHNRKVAMIKDPTPEYYQAYARTVKRYRILAATLFSLVYANTWTLLLFLWNR